MNDPRELVTEDLLTAFEDLSIDQLAAIPGAADSLTRAYADLAELVDRLEADIVRIRRLQGRIRQFLGWVRDAGHRQRTGTGGRPMPPSAPPATTLPQDGRKEG